MIDTTTRAAQTTSWQHTSVRTAAELLLGLSFFATMAFGGFGALTGHASVLAGVSAIVFLTTLTCVLVSWFSGAGDPVEADR
ncbi:hypothetical protein [Curtobacterium sp. 9128]|uniref:hypothetical protein n=1 Tax=Curtobacterium sp. 9128 TaxID=1793722 RepID=UPI0011AA63F2|nr:hypothetical protein [Curtobacterium sp. 9128]